MEKQVILCDEDGKEVGSMEKVKAHIGDGVLHRAFSIFVFRKNGEELLIQKRSSKKMLWPLHWSNSCCSHPEPNSDFIESAEKRLDEECGFTCPLVPVGSFVYKAKDPENRGTEFEYDTVLVGNVSERIKEVPDPEEIVEAKWVNVKDLMVLMKKNPLDFTPWFFIGLKAILDKTPS